MARGSQPSGTMWTNEEGGHRCYLGKKKKKKEKKRRTGNGEGRENNCTRQRGEKTRSLPPPSITATQRRWKALTEEVENLMEEVEKVARKRKSSLRGENREQRTRWLLTTPYRGCLATPYGRSNPKWQQK
jgi:hypothetical protein